MAISLATSPAEVSVLIHQGPRLLRATKLHTRVPARAARERDKAPPCTASCHPGIFGAVTFLLPLAFLGRS